MVIYIKENLPQKFILKSTIVNIHTVKQIDTFRKTTTNDVAGEEGKQPPILDNKILFKKMLYFPGK